MTETSTSHDDKLPAIAQGQVFWHRGTIMDVRQLAKNEVCMEKNVLDTELQICSNRPRTGFYRDGLCRAGDDDLGTHTVCAVVTEEFLEYTRDRGNDLISARPEYDFPGLRPGDRWCLCALRWEEARLAGKAPLIVLEATHQRTLELVDYAELIQYAWRGSLRRPE
ncbi:DUF2237 family protein [Acidithiobacillus marinus]|nr:DUF2237 domain-containing protein [Acidithiobacillus marinus]